MVILLMQMVGKMRTLKAPILVVVLSALIALLITIVTRPGVPSEPAAAGPASISLLEEEHALVADFARRQVEAERAAVESSRVERQHPANGVAEMASLATVPMPRRAPAVRVASAEPAHAENPAIAAQPLPLQAPAVVAEQPRPGGVVQGARRALATVQHIPQWVSTGVREAANWAIVGPVQSIARLPERRFL